MLPNVKNYYRPTEISEAVQLLSSDSERNVVLGGGTQLALSQAPGIDGLVDLRNLGLDHIRTEKNSIVLGSRCRPTDAIRYEGLAQIADGIVARAASNYLAEVQRNRASLGGILISASSWADIATALLAVGGEVVIVGPAGEKTLSIDQFFTTGPAKAAQRSIIKELRVPSGGCGAYLRVARTETDISIVDVAVRLDLVGNSISHARVAVGGVASLPIRLDAVEKNLVDNKLSADLVGIATREINVEAASDFRASGEYRNELTKVLARRCLLDLVARAR
ncbi:MAG: FAD binding domain-containing protein [Candidatus Hydrogenedentota bacterium]